MPGPRSGHADVLPGLEGTAPVVQSPAQTARRAWEALVPLLSARPEVRLRHGRGYPRAARYRVPAAEHPGVQPAAMHIYTQGPRETFRGRLLALDFDTHGQFGRDQAAADAQALVDQLTDASVGARVIVDYAPASGGLHVYLPFRSYMPAEQLRDLARAIRERLHGPRWNRTLDIKPMLNPAEGLIRPPGAAHHRGGFQELITPLPAAVAIASAGNGPEVWQRLQEEFAPEYAALAAPEPVSAVQVEQLHRELAWVDAEGNRLLSPAMRQIALHARYDRERYPTPSEARGALLTFAAAHGWSFEEVRRATFITGAWPGLARLTLTKGDGRERSTEQAAQFLLTEWDSVLTHLATIPQKPSSDGQGRKIGHNPPLVRPVITRGGWEPAPGLILHGSQRGSAVASLSGLPLDRYLRDLSTAVHLLEPIRYPHSSVRVLLQGLLAMAAYSGRAELRVGTRALSLASGPHRTTIGDLLNELYDEDDPLVELVERGSGKDADTVRLRIPDAVADLVDWRAWRPGPFVPVHPVLQALGTAVTAVYTVLDAEWLTRWELERRSGLSERSLRRALDELGAHGLAERLGTSWRRVAGTDPSKIKYATAAMIIFAERVEAYRAERAAWHAYLGEIPDQLTPAHILATAEAPSPEDCDAHTPEATGAGESDAAEPTAADPPTSRPQPGTAQASLDGPDFERIPAAPAWWNQATPPWLRCPYDMNHPDYIPPPEPPDADAAWPEYWDAALEQQMAAAAAVDIGALYAAPEPGWIELDRRGRRRPGQPLPWDRAAALLGISERAARALRPGGRRYTDRQIAQLLAPDPPPWIGDEQAARAEGERRREQAERRRVLRHAHRQSWAAALTVPAAALPSRMPAYSDQAAEGMLADPPPWLLAYRQRGRS